jgi:hypothetical protein
VGRSDAGLALDQAYAIEITIDPGVIPAWTVILAPWGRCVLAAEDDALTLRIEADDPGGARRIRDIVTRDIERLGHRESLAVTWHRPGPGGAG